MPEPISARRREVLDTAARLFHERGYQGTSMDEIADAVGLTKGSLYHHFDGKAEILTAIYEEAADLVVAQTEGHSDDEPAADVFAALVRGILEMIAQHRYHVTVYYQEMRWVREWLPEEDAARIRAKVRTFIDFVDGVFKRGIEEGALRPVDSRLAAYALIGMASWSYQWYQPKGRLDPDGVAELFASIYLDGVRA
ncbi:MAG: TetR/AcrR family transcriptional regulator [Solirubrobacterales bacterium]